MKIFAQYGAPVYIQNFGEGTQNPNLIGPALPAGFTDFLYSTDLCPPAGSYTLARRININGCFNDEWIPLRRDYSPETDLGMMMIVNNISSPLSRLLYKDTVNKQLCPGVNYHCSVAVINIDKPSLCTSGPDFPLFDLRVETETGQLIKNDTTRPGIGYAPSVWDQYVFTGFGFDFTMPVGVNRLVLKLVLLHNTYWCAEDFAIDDIVIAPIGPKVSISFLNEPEGTIVKSVCFQDNKTVSFSSNLGAYYTNPALQWQQSTDNGISWTDIPGATSGNYTRVLSISDTFLFRVSAGEAANIANPDCRVVSNFYKVEVDGPPTNYTISNNSPVCAGQDLKFLGEGAARYTWTGPNGFYDNVPYAHIFFSSLKDSGMYYVEIISLGGCRVTDSTYVKMIGTDVHAGPDTSICKGQSVRLRTSTGIKYEWTPATGLSATNINNPVAKPESTTAYTVQVTDIYGCIDTAKLQVKVMNKVKAQALLQGTNDLCGLYDSASFKDISSGIIAYREWDFDNGQTDTTITPPVQYYLTGNQPSFLVRLAIWDTAGCADTIYHRIYVQNNCYIAVPSAFTPNGDGLNDELGPLNAYKATNLVFRIYSRSGQLVFETKDWTKKWNGSIGNNKQAMGVYVWILQYTDASNKKIVLRGTSALIR